MDTQEATERAQQKIDRGEDIDAWDVQSLCGAVYNSAYREGKRVAYAEVKEFLSKRADVVLE